MMRARPDENSRFARRFKPRSHDQAFEAVDYFTTFAHAAPHSERIRESRMSADEIFR